MIAKPPSALSRLRFRVARPEQDAKGVQAVGGPHALRRLRACHLTRNPGCDTPLGLRIDPEGEADGGVKKGLDVRNFARHVSVKLVIVEAAVGLVGLEGGAGK